MRPERKSKKGANSKTPCETPFPIVLGVTVILIVLTMGAALAVYFSNPQEDMQKRLLDALIMAFMGGIGAVVGLLASRRN